MKISNNIKAGLNNISSIILNEFKTISGSFAIVLVLMGGYLCTVCYIIICMLPTWSVMFRS